MLSRELVTGLRQAMMDADYRLDPVLERLGQTGQAGLSRNTTVAAEAALGDAQDAQATLIRLFPLQQPVSWEAASQSLPIEELLSAGLLRVADADGRSVRAEIDVRPYGFADDQGEWAGWVVSDLQPGLNHHPAAMRPDYVLGVNPASTTLAQLTVPTTVQDALDLGTGCGVQTLHLARHSTRVVATDLNPRACDLAGLTLALNGLAAESDMGPAGNAGADTNDKSARGSSRRPDAPPDGNQAPHVEIRRGSLYEPVAEERFDLIVANPPYVISPTGPKEQRLLYRENELSSDGLVEKLVRDAPNHLREGGVLQILANWAVRKDESWQERLASWVAHSGCDLWVVQREHLDRFAYIELWLSDAGLTDGPRWRTAYDEWLAYFDEYRISEVGMGWITLVNAGRDDPRVEFDDWPYPVAQPLGPAIAAHQGALTAAGLPDERLLAARWTLDPGVVEQTTGRPGAGYPARVVLAQTTGFRRTMEVDTALGGVLGACDGELPLVRIVAAVAELVDEPVTALRTRLLPRLRQAIREGFLTPAA